ncbi:hypothetical protein EPN42_04635 [bacterium]|nr:MAG: hypothetical protein EPN42_04635 [bacterium]
MPDFDARNTTNAARASATLAALIRGTTERLEGLRAGGTLEVLTAAGLRAVPLPIAVSADAERFRREPGDAGPVLTAIGIPVSDDRLQAIAERLKRIPASVTCTVRILEGERIGYEGGNLPPLFLTALGLVGLPPDLIQLDALLPIIEARLAEHDTRMILLDGYPVTPSILARAIDTMKGSPA